MADRAEVERIVDEFVAMAEDAGRRLRVATGGPAERAPDDRVPDVSHLLRVGLVESVAYELDRRDGAVRLWLDDVRPAPSGWVLARSVNDAIEVMRRGGVAFASLDHDLGEFAHDGGDGSRLTDWMAENDLWPAEGVRVHSSNAVGVSTMLATVDRYAGYAGRVRAARGVAPEGGWPPALMG